MIGAGATAVQRRHTRRKSLIDQLWADEVHMGVQRACSDDHLLARQAFGRDASDHPGSHSIHHVRIARLADADDAVPLDADVGLDDALYRIDDECVGDDEIERFACRAVAHLPHALAKRLPAAKLALVAIHSVVLLHLDDQSRITQLEPVARGRAEHGAILRAAQYEGRTRLGRRLTRRVAEALGDHACHHLLLAGLGRDAINQPITREHDAISGDLRESDGLVVAWLEAHGRAGGDVEA